MAKKPKEEAKKRLLDVIKKCGITDNAAYNLIGLATSALAEAYANGKEDGVKRMV